ncbi:hypothetical protein T4B_8577, partial [Trichinella pseudospiralis]
LIKNFLRLLRINDCVSLFRYIKSTCNIETLAFVGLSENSCKFHFIYSTLATLTHFSCNVLLLNEYLEEMMEMNDQKKLMTCASLF